jgi:creatinine amidohydrolase/Fe(II)-dependent formamide hydrolase-like protein
MIVVTWVCTWGSAVASAQILDVRELQTSQIERLDRARTVVLLTGGILEEHGPFLPSYSDGYQTEFIATRLAEAIAARPGWTVLRFPALPLGTFPASDIGQKFSFPGSYGVRSTTLRAVYMDLVTDLGDAGFRWGFLLNLHGAPTHNEMLDQVAQYFSDTFGGRMVHLTGLASVAGAVPKDIFSADERTTEGFSVHADADEHSRLLFLRPDLVSPSIKEAGPAVGRNFADLVALSKQDDWAGYFGTPAIATQAAGARAMAAMKPSLVRRPRSKHFSGAIFRWSRPNRPRRSGSACGSDRPRSGSSTRFPTRQAGMLISPAPSLPRSVRRLRNCWLDRL